MSTQEDLVFCDHVMELKSRILKVINDYATEKDIEYQLPAFVAFSIVACELAFSSNKSQDKEELSKYIDIMSNTAKNFISIIISFKKIQENKVEIE